MPKHLVSKGRQMLLPLLTRGRVLAVCAGLAALWALAHRLPERSVAGVAQLLGHQASGIVHDDEFVWEPSQGSFSDFWSGRGVIFLSRSEAGGPRETLRAWIHLTPSGQPLFVRGLENLSVTSLGDEQGLVWRAGRVAYRTVFDGQVQSVTVFDPQKASELLRVSPRTPVSELAFELTDDALVLALPEGPAAVRFSDGGLEEGSVKLAVDRRPRQAAPLSTSEGPVLSRATPPSSTFPPDGYQAAPGQDTDHAAVWQSPSGKTFAADGRLLAFELTAGRAAPPSQTGFVVGVRQGGQEPMLRVVLPAEQGGARFEGGALGPIPRDAPTLVIDDARRLRLLAWPFETFGGRDLTHAIELHGSAESERFSLCVLPNGHLMGGPPAETALDACLARVEGPGHLEWSTLPSGTDKGMQWENSALLLGFARTSLPLPPLGSDQQWVIDPSIASEPEWVPSAHRTQRDTLGTKVTIWGVDTRRFQWALRAGLKEKSHRMRGDFPEELTPADRPRARLAIGLGVGKRKSPRGLRIDGSTGHRFRGREGLLSVGPLGPRIWGPERAEVEPREDGTELPLSVLEGQLTAFSRQRGPLQPRMDLCLLGDLLLLARAEFDSHEATSRELVQLGCDLAVSLDRGSEPEASLSIGAAGPFEGTTLFGLVRPLEGGILSGAEGLDGGVPSDHK